MRLLAIRISEGAQLLDTLVEGLSATIGRAAWTGHDASGFAATWWQSLRPRVTVVAQGLRHLAQDIAAQAEQQVHASTAATNRPTATRERPDLRRLGHLARQPAGPSRDEQIAQILKLISPLALLELARADPAAVGQLPGIDYRIRDYANRLAIAAYLSAPPAHQSGSEETQRGAMLTELLHNSPADTYVLAFDPAGDGKIAVAIGDPQSAKNVAVLIPGIGTELHSFGGHLDDARRVQGDSPQTATVAWLGYDPPGGTGDVSRWGDLPAAMGEDRAVQGAQALRHFVSGMNFADTQNVSVLGHSYGSVVVMHAAAQAGLPAANRIVTLGSPGSAAFNSVGDLQLAQHQEFYALAADGDVVSGAYGDLVPGLASGAGPFTPNPWAPDFGSARMPSDPGFGGTRVETDAWANATRDSKGHSQYYASASGGLLSVQAIVMGDAPPQRSAQIADLPAYERGLIGEVRERITQRAVEE